MAIMPLTFNKQRQNSIGVKRGVIEMGAGQRWLHDNAPTEAWLDYLLYFHGLRWASLTSASLRHDFSSRHAASAPAVSGCGEWLGILNEREASEAARRG